MSDWIARGWIDYSRGAQTDVIPQQPQAPTQEQRAAASDPGNIVPTWLTVHKNGYLVNELGERVDKYGRLTRPRGVKGKNSSQNQPQAAWHRQPQAAWNRTSEESEDPSDDDASATGGWQWTQWNRNRASEDSEDRNARWADLSSETR